MAKKRSRHHHSRAARRNAPPGSTVYVGAPRDHTVNVSVMDYSATHFHEQEGARLGDLREFADSDSTTWVNLDGVHDVETVRAVCEAFGVHALAIEDVLNPGARPKVEDYGEVIFVVVKMLQWDETDRSVDIEQIAAVLGSRWVLTFQERQGDLFEALRKRIRGQAGRIREMPADYLLHGVLDAIVDGYFVVLERFEEEINSLDDHAPDATDSSFAPSVHARKTELAELRRLVWPMREAVVELTRSEGGLIAPRTVPYLRDLRDHVLQVVDLVDGYRDRLTALLELHIAVTSIRLNEVMRVLTIVSTLFIPITFIAGVYGMNFAHMPELQQPWAYPAVLAVMATVVTSMALWLRRQGWL